jgi:hypothetical protein
MSSINSCKTCIDVALLTYVSNPMTGSVFQIITFIGLTASRRKRGGGEPPFQFEGIPHNHVDLPPLASREATEYCIPIGNSEVLLEQSMYKSPGHAWNDADIIELLSFRHKSLMEGDLNA